MMVITPSPRRGIYKGRRTEMETINLLDATRQLLDLKMERKTYNKDIGERIKSLEVIIKQLAKE